MKKSICIEKIFLEYDFYDRFAKVAEAGFEYVEFGYWLGRDIDRIKAECDKYGLTVTTFSADFKASLIVPDDRAEFLDYIAKSIEVAKKLNCKNLVI
ncbi:MAG: TIM barrel protein, partial [Butyricicoccus sp.]